MEPSAKGTVTPLASLFSEEDAKKAASYVEEKIGEKRVEMNRLQQFVEENTNLINLLTKLPDQLHHNVMASFYPFITLPYDLIHQNIINCIWCFCTQVPFGKMAFFPGRLIHTNECLVSFFMILYSFFNLNVIWFYIVSFLLWGLRVSQ